MTAEAEIDLPPDSRGIERREHRVESSFSKRFQEDDCQRHR
jgi:hypothetical protein